MGTHQQILNILHRALEDDNGNRVQLMHHLGAEKSRSTLYKALESKNPVLPRPELLCQWLDKLGVRIVDSGQETSDCVSIRIISPVDLLLEPAKRPYRGYCYFRGCDIEPYSESDFVGIEVNSEIEMPPSIREKDFVLLDVSDSAKAEREEGAVHFLKLGDAFAFRRLQRGQDAMILVSDTPEIIPITVSDSGNCPYSVLGRVAAVQRLFK